MSINLDLPKAATAAVDELARQAVALEPKEKELIDYFVTKMQGILVGRTITITIK